MGDLGLEVGGQVDNVDGVEGAFLGADTASDAEALRDEGDLGGRVDFDTQLARTDDGARFLAFLSAFLGFALVRVDNGNTGELVRHVGGGFVVTAIAGVECPGGANCEEVEG
jgi:hypothetical protein